MEWMRCNNCALKVGDNRSQFHLTQCGHVYCNACIQRAEVQCFQCGEKGSISLPLKEPVSPVIAHLFDSPACLIDKALQAQQFQETQLNLCLQQFKLKEDKYQALKEAYWDTAGKLKKLCQKYHEIKMMASAYQKQECKNRGSTPSFTASDFQTPSNQMISSQHQGHYQNRFHPLSGNVSTPNLSTPQFRKPTITRLPKSAKSAGYYTASSHSSLNSSSTYVMNTPNNSIM